MNNQLIHSVISDNNAFLLKRAADSIAHFNYLLVVPACFAIAAITILGAVYFRSISQQPTIANTAFGNLLVLLGIIDGTALAVLGIGYFLISGYNSTELLEQIQESSSVNSTSLEIEETKQEDLTIKEQTSQKKAS